MSRKNMLLMALLVEGGFILLAWGLGWLWHTPAFARIRFTASAVVYGTAASVPMLLGLVWVDRARWRPLVRFRRTIEEEVAPLFASCTVIDMMVISLLAGLGEEVLFRGVVQTALGGVIGIWGAVAVTAVVFGAAHFITVTYAVYAALIGVYLGVLLAGFENLLVPILAHAVYDFIALLYLVSRSKR